MLIESNNPLFLDTLLFLVFYTLKHILVILVYLVDRLIIKIKYFNKRE